LSYAQRPVNSEFRHDLQAARQRENRRLRHEHYARRIWPLGDRVLFELVDHIATRFGIEDEIDHLLARFVGLDPHLLRTLGGDNFPALPLRVVGAGQ
jgi:hypothetical protein